jgi:hypothetical protein
MEGKVEPDLQVRQHRILYATLYAYANASSKDI